MFWCNTHTHTERNEHVSMLVFRWGLDPKIPVFGEQTKLFALEHTTTVIGLKVNGEAYF